MVAAEDDAAIILQECRAFVMEISVCEGVVGDRRALKPIDEIQVGSDRVCSPLQTGRRVARTARLAARTVSNHRPVPVNVVDAQRPIEHPVFGVVVPAAVARIGLPREGRYQYAHVRGRRRRTDDERDRELVMICAQSDSVDPQLRCRRNTQLECGRPVSVGKVILVKMDGVVDVRTVCIQRSNSSSPVWPRHGSGRRVHRSAVMFVPRGVHDPLAADIPAQVPAAENRPQLLQTLAGREIHDLVRTDGDAKQDR